MHRRKPSALMEVLEARALLATITVTGTGDTIASDGLVTLREAITAANTNAASGDAPAGDAGVDAIEFNIPGAGVQKISPASLLPTITEALIIDGYSQPGASPNTRGAGQGSDAVLLIELDGDDNPLSSAVDGLRISGGASIIQGLVIHSFPRHGIFADSDSNGIQGNYIGVDPAGTAALPNGGDGIQIDGGGNNLIGGGLPEHRNVIVCDASSIFSTAAVEIRGAAEDNVIQGNFLGTDASGTVDLSPPSGRLRSGIAIFGTSGVRIGGAQPGEGNLISGNNGIGINLTDAPGTTIEGNLIGTDVTGTLDLGNGQNGISVSGGTTANIGGDTAAAGNVISGNGLDGIRLNGVDDGSFVGANFIGTDRTATRSLPNEGDGVVIATSRNSVGGTAGGAGNVIANNTGNGVVVLSNAVNNPILGNRIFNNGGIGIDLATVAGGVTPNDGPQDLDSGANNLQNFPVITSVDRSGSDSVVQGFLEVPAGEYRIEIFAGDVGDPSGNGEALRLLDSLDVTSDLNGATIAAVVPLLTPGEFVTATATDANGNTSEFGPNFALPTTGADLDVTVLTQSQTNPVPHVITVNNDGPDAANDVELTIEVPDGSTFVSFAAPAGFTVTSMPPGGGTGTVVVTSAQLAALQSAEFTLVVQGTPGLFVEWTAAVTSSTVDPDPSDNSAPGQTFVDAAPDRAELGFEIDAPASVAAGETITYTLDLTNFGPDAATNAVLDVPIPSNTTFVSFTAPAGWVTTAPAVGGTGTATATNPSLAAGGGPEAFTLVVRVDPGTPPDTTITAGATVDSDVLDNNPDNEEDTATTLVTAGAPAADLSVITDVSPGQATFGQEVTYTITVRNDGPNTATGVVVADTLPPTGTFVSATGGATPVNGILTVDVGSLAPGATATVQVVVRTPAGGDEVFTNIVDISSAVDDSDTSDNRVVDSMDLAPVAATADLAVTTFTDSPDPVAAGQDLTYTIVVTNNGPSPATGVRLTDFPLPANTEFVSTSVGSFDPANNRVVADLGNLAVGGTATVVIVVRPTIEAIGTTLFNTVGASANEADPDLTNNQTQVTTTQVIAPSADTAGPTIVSLQRFGFHARPTRLVLSFNEALDPARAADLANYRLVNARGAVIRIRSATYDPETRTVTLLPARLLNLHRTFVLTTSGSGITDLSGNALDGDGDGRNGGDFTGKVNLSIFADHPGQARRSAGADRVAHPTAGAGVKAIRRGLRRR
jgi:uncharacterized repeat protein (TIGR01451 family)